MSMVYRVIVSILLSVGLIDGRFNFCEAGEIFLFFFSRVEKQALLQTLVCGLALSGLQMCLLLELDS
jgi:hypothetical protein